MRIGSYVSLLLILSFNQQRVLCRHVPGDTGGTDEKFKLPRDNEDVHNPNFWHHLTGNEREQNDHDRIIFPDYEQSLDGHSTYEPLDMETCVLSCKLNSNSDHVCGTDGKTYDNMDHLLCAAKCGVDVRLRHLSSCPQRTGRNSLIETNNINACISSCPTTSEYNPLCGTDNKTYTNPGKLYCAQQCGVDVQLKYNSTCPKTLTTTANPLISTGSPLPTTNSDVRVCINSCLTTPEYNPVCGSDGKTYNNIGKFECAKYCGIDVQIKYNSTCPKTFTTTANPSISTGSPLPTTNSDIRVCINSCPTTSEYNPVCGSDGKTYNNIGKLECAKYCGIDVQLIYHFACRKTPTIMANRAGSNDPHLPSHPPHPHQLIQRHNLLL